MGELSRSTLAVSAGRPEPHPGAPINAPIVLSATFHAGDEAANYLRHSSSDTIRAFEAAVGALEGGDALAFSSGMAATAAHRRGAAGRGRRRGAAERLLGDQHDLRRAGAAGAALTVRRVDITDTEDVLAALPGAQLLWVETPTNPLVGVADLPALTAAAHEEGALACVDSTWNSPMVLRPLEHGADVVMHSATKYLAGHSDLLMGVLVTDQPELRSRLRSRRDLTGAIPGALETFLALRGVRTLAVRMERAQANAMELATRLAAPPGSGPGAVPRAARRPRSRPRPAVARRLRRDDLVRGRRWGRGRGRGVRAGRR